MPKSRLDKVARIQLIVQQIEFEPREKLVWRLIIKDPCIIKIIMHAHSIFGIDCPVPTVWVANAALVSWLDDACCGSFNSWLY